jgi:uncharacterized membrane protein
MTYHEVVSNVVDVVEGVGAGIMVVGSVGACVWYAQDLRRGAKDAYQVLRENIGRVILLGLEVLIIADIIRTIVVQPSLESVAVLGIIVVIRILLSFSLEVEVDGAWTPVDPTIVRVMQRFAALDPTVWPAHRAIGAILLRVGIGRQAVLSSEDVRVPGTFMTSIVGA